MNVVKTDDRELKEPEDQADHQAVLAFQGCLAHQDLTALLGRVVLKAYRDYRDSKDRRDPTVATQPRVNGDQKVKRAVQSPAFLADLDYREPTEHRVAKEKWVRQGHAVRLATHRTPYLDDPDFRDGKAIRADPARSGAMQFTDYLE